MATNGSFIAGFPPTLWTISGSDSGAYRCKQIPEGSPSSGCLAMLHRTNLLITEARTGTLADETIQQTAHTWHWSTHFSGGLSHPESREMIAASVREHVQNKLKVKRPTDWARLIDQCVQELEKGKLGSGAVPIGAGAEELNKDCLTRVFERFSAERKDELSNKTLREWTTAVRRFTSLHGDKPITKITRSHIDQFYQALCLLPSRPGSAISELAIEEQIEWAEAQSRPLLSPASVAKNITAIKSILDFAFKRTSLIPEELRMTWQNPCNGFVGQGKKRKRKERKTFEPEHIRTLFDPVSYSRATRYPPARFWIPLILHYTGARLTEIAQVSLSDIKALPEAMSLRITDEHDPAVPDDNKTLKNDSSRRSIPIHDDLIQIGLGDYVEKLKAAGHTWLFPELPYDKGGERASAISKWFGRYRTRCGFTGDHVLHSLRHSFKQSGIRAGNVKESLLKMMQGHHLPDVGDAHYGAHARHDASLLKEQVLDKIEFPDINVEGLAKIASELRITLPESSTA